jgi:demethylmenaquinone methyltransferase/2-methoxy-6-polyprenyl-1,4-benzoquinol methylase
MVVSRRIQQVKHLDRLFSEVALRYDLLNDLISLGLHRLWKRRLAWRVCLHLPAGGGAVADLASGTGDMIRRLNRLSIRSLVAIDPCQAMIRRCPRADQAGADRIRSVSEELPLKDGSLRGLTCTFGIRNFQDRSKAWREWHRVLIPGGVAGILELHPPRSVWYGALLLLYMKKVVTGWGRWWGAQAPYDYLQDSVRTFASPPQLIREAHQAGLQIIDCVPLLPAGMASLILLRRDG